MASSIPIGRSCPSGYLGGDGGAKGGGGVGGGGCGGGEGGLASTVHFCLVPLVGADASQALTVTGGPTSRQRLTSACVRTVLSVSKYLRVWRGQVRVKRGGYSCARLISHNKPHQCHKGSHMVCAITKAAHTISAVWFRCPRWACRGSPTGSSDCRCQSRLDRTTAGRRRDDLPLRPRH